MKLHLSVYDGASDADLSFEVTEGASVEDVARSVPWLRDTDAPLPVGLTLSAGSAGVLSASQPALTSGLRSGLRVRLVSAGPERTSGAVGELRWKRAPDSEAICLPLVNGDNTIGRGAAASLTVDDPSLSRTHFRVTIGEGAQVLDLGSSNGTAVNGVALRGDAANLVNGDVIGAGNARFEFRLAARQQASESTTTEGAVRYFNRPPRTEPRYGGRAFKAPKPPERPDPEPFGWAVALVPLIMAGAMYALTKSVAVIGFAFISPLMIVGQWYQSRKNARDKYARLLAQYRTDVDTLERDVSQEQVTEIAARRIQAPPTPELMRSAVARDPNLWQRGVDDDDFLLVRLGQGDQPSVVTIEIPEGGERDERAAIETLPSRYGIVADVPVEAALRDGGLGIAGDSRQRDAVVRSVLAQITALHSPAELAVAALVGESEARSWEWLKWLPHTRYPLSRLEGEHLASTPSGCADLLRRLAALTASGSSKDLNGKSVVASWIVVLVDEHAHIDRPALDALLRSGSIAGVTFVWMSDRAEDLPRFCRHVVSVDAERPILSYLVAGSGSVQRGIRADLVSADLIDSYVRELAPVQDVSARTAAELDLPPVVLLSELLGGEKVLHDPEQIAERWKANSQRTRTLEAPVGLAPGAEYSIDIVRQGPHGFLIGTTGSGKSELLRTLLVSVAASYAPERINFLLIDFKGGAALKPFLELPHTIGLVTNLREGEANADEKLEAKVRRTIVWLRAELQRRMQVLDQFGVSDIADMEKKKAPGTPPRLVIVADEFAVLANKSNSTGDDVIDEIVNIARLGRSLGIHLLLATQRAGGVISDNIRANTNLRIALRVQDTTESNDVVGAPDAANISLSTPGRAFVSIGAGSLIQLQTASSTGHTSALRTMPRVRAEPFSFIGRTPTPSTPPALPSGSGPNDLELLTDAIRGASKAWSVPTPDTHWVDPPAEVVALDTVDDSSNPFAITVGMLDDPAAQAVRPATIDLSTVGHVLVYGAGGAGKTVLARTAIASLARRFTSDLFQFVGLDCSGRGLAPLAAFPQCRGIITSDNVDLVYRLFRDLRETITRRTDRFAAHGVADLAEERASRPGGADQHLVVVVLDGLNAFAEAFDRIDAGTLVDRLGGLLLDGRAAGVHFLLTAGRRGGIPMGVISNIQQTVVLRMASHDEYSMVDVKPSHFPIEAPPGRGLLGRFTFQTGLVVSKEHSLQLSAARASFDEDRLEEVSDEARTGDAQIRALTTSSDFARSLGGSTAPSIATLPEQLPLGSLPVPNRPWSYCVAVGDSSSGGIAASLEESHLVVCGPPRSGKSNALGAVAASLRRSTPGLETHLICSRRSLASESGVFDRVVLNDSDGLELVQRLNDELAGGRTRPILVCVDDFPDLDESTFGYGFNQIVATARKGAPIRFVIAGEARSMGSNFNDGARSIRRYRHGLLLQPDVDLDGDLVGARLPRQLWRQFGPGRGYHVAGSRVELAQVGALPEVVSVGSRPE